MRRSLVLASVVVAFSCSSSETAPPTTASAENEKTIGPEGGEIVAPDESPFAGIALKIPAGALTAPTKISFVGTNDETPLPPGAERVGPQLRLEPQGLVLQKPAELTLPLEGELLNNYEGTPSSCKVWSRKDAAWERLEQITSTPTSVTVPITTLSTAAAGVVFAPVSSACLKNPASCEPQPTVLTPRTVVEPITCAPVASKYCVIQLPEIDKAGTSYIDEFASLTVRQQKVYWTATTKGADGSVNGVTIVRYDLAADAPVFVYPAYTGASFGTISERGRIAFDGGGNPWVSVGGFGNVRFSETGAPTAFDQPATGTSLGPVGVLGSDVGAVIRFRKQNVSGHTDVRAIAAGAGGDGIFVFNYPIIPIETVVGVAFDNQHALFRSVHRGASAMFDANIPGFSGYTAPRSGRGVDVDNDPLNYGAFAINATRTQVAVATADGGRVFQHSFEASGDRFNDVGTTTFAAPVRDMDYGTDGKLYAISSGRLEVQVASGGGTSIVPLAPSTVDPSAQLSPWRIRALPGTNDMLINIRGPLIKKGQFIILRRVP